MRRSLALGCVSIVFAFALGAAACTEPGGGHDAAADAGSSDAATRGDGASSVPRDGGVDAVTPGQRDAGDASPVPVSVADACAGLAAARCAKEDSCTVGAGIAIRYGDAKTCAARLTDECTFLAGWLDATAVMGCATAYAAQSCSDFGAGVRPTACAFHGERKEGDPCADAVQCASSFCKEASPGTCGRCAAPPVEGARCATAADCGAAGNLDCRRGQCAQRAAKGAACGAVNHCAPGLSCLMGDGGPYGTCVDAAQINQPCDATGASAPDCDRALALYCGVRHTCERVHAASTAQPCGDLPGFGFVACKGGGMCASGDGGPEHTCVAPVADGASCNPSAGPPCVAPAQCVARTDGGPTDVCMRADLTVCQ